MKDLFHAICIAILLLCNFDCSVGADGTARDAAEIKKLKAKIAKLEAAVQPTQSKNCDRCLTPHDNGDFAPNTTCKIERTWRRISETPERYELIAGRWYLIIREEWTWSDRMKCETVKPR